MIASRSGRQARSNWPSSKIWAVGKSSRSKICCSEMQNLRINNHFKKIQWQNWIRASAISFVGNLLLPVGFPSKICSLSKNCNFRPCLLFLTHNASYNIISLDLTKQQHALYRTTLIPIAKQAPLKRLQKLMIFTPPSV